MKEQAELDCFESDINYNHAPTAEMLGRVVQDMRKVFSTFQELCGKCCLLTERYTKESLK